MTGRLVYPSCSLHCAWHLLMANLSVALPYAGANDEWQLGTLNNVHAYAPMVAGSGRTFTALCAGVKHVCGLQAGGRALCWVSGLLAFASSWVPCACLPPLTLLLPAQRPTRR